MSERFERRHTIGAVLNLIRWSRRQGRIPGRLWGWIDEEAATLGLRPCGDEAGADRRWRSTAEEKLESRHAASASAKPGSVEANIRAIAGLAALDATDTAILGLIVRYHLGTPLESLMDRLCDMPFRTADRRALMVLAAALAITPSELAARLRPDRRLVASGLLRIEGAGRVEPMERLVRVVRETRRSSEVRRRLLGETPPATLAMDDFDHIAADRDHVARLLKAAVSGAERGVHVLVYGPPGTGKTEFCKTVAAHLAVPLHAVGEADEEGGEPDRDERLAELRLAQTLLADAGPALVLFDEMQDLFAEVGHRLFGGGREGSRAWLHRLLETAPVPVLWTANDIDDVGPAVLRRLTHAVELRTPPAAVRARMWSRECRRQGVKLPPDAVTSLSAHEEASPALLATAVRAARLTGDGLPAIRRSLSAVAKAVNSGRTVKEADSVGDLYDPALVRADTDLAALADSLARPGASRRFSLCLFGLPGTGKSAYARHLAARLGMAVLVRRASDLKSPYVGECERNIADAFAQARDEGRFLILDEADSFLCDRRDARESWQVSEVNEMLTWMEAHPLPFACTTNLMERLDPASLRRFTFKVRFEALSGGQVTAAFRRFFGLEPPPGLGELTVLTPGDFAVVRRRAELTDDLGDPAALLRLLAVECAAKPGAARPIGFRMAG